MERGGLGAVAKQQEVSSMGGTAQRGPVAGTGGGGDMDGLVPVSPPNTLICPVGPSHLQAHVVGEAGEEVMLHMAADERVAKGPVEQGVAGQVEDTQAHEVDPLGFPIGGEHGEADVLWEKQGGDPVAPVTPPALSRQSQPRLWPCEGMKALARLSHVLGFGRQPQNWVRP